MKKIISNFLANKHKTVPILSFPSCSLLNISVNELISSSERQLEGMLAIAERCSIGASLNMMDLSVEAEAFGAKIHFCDNEVPTVIEGVISDIEDFQNIIVPQIGDGRTSIYIEGVKKAKERIKDIPVFCGVIGPYSLAGRIFDMTELMMECFDSPDKVKSILEKTTEFLKKYILAFKEAGADGVVIAEPAAGLLSPALHEEFSAPYVKEIIESISDENFIVCYHNCGNAVIKCADSISSLGADIYHFGNAIELKNIIPLMPEDAVVMGNVDPVLFKTGTAAEIEAAVEKVFYDCKDFNNFMISSGCDIPFDAKWKNLDAYFNKVSELYGKN